MICPECTEVMEIFGEGADQVAACIRCPVTFTFDSKETTDEAQTEKE